MKYLRVLLLLLFTVTVSYSQNIKLLEQGRDCNIRGMSVINDRIAWVSGSNGYVAVTTNGGKTWRWSQVKGFEKSDFRDIEAFSGKEAVIMSSGTPALILKTKDGGANWDVCYRNDDKACFLDEMDFFDKNQGVVMGDPTGGKFLLMQTKDGGSTWQLLENRPKALPNEAAFAASGSGIRTIKNKIMFVTGGAGARLWQVSNDGKWSAEVLPITCGKASTGAFALALGGRYKVVVGGDYQQKNRSDSTACYYDVSRQDSKFELSKQMPKGYQSCVSYLGGSGFIATGTSGSHLSSDGGKTWNLINEESFNVCQKARYGKWILLAGENGKIAAFKNY